MSKDAPKLRWLEWFIDINPPIHRFYLSVIGDGKRIASAELYPYANGWECHHYAYDQSCRDRNLGRADTPEEAMQLVIDVLDIDPDLVDPEIWEVPRMRTLPLSERERKVKDACDVIRGSVA